MNRLHVSKILFYATSIIGFLGISFAIGLYSGLKKTFPYEVILYIKNSVEAVLIEAPTLSKTHPEHFLQPARYEGSGVTINISADNEEAFIFLAGFFSHGNELRLIRRNGTVIARWPVRFSEIFPDTSHLKKPPDTDWNVDIHGALALPDGSVVFNFEYAGLVKLNRCGEVIWILPRMSHHSVEKAEGGGFWVPGRRDLKKDDSPFPPYQNLSGENTIMKVSEDGKVLHEISVPKLFYDNGLESLVTSTGNSFKARQSHWEILHLNKIAELSSDIANDFPQFNAGDLVLSIREYNLILIVDPDAENIKWWRIGPWLRQHDPEFIPGGKLVVFNNNTYRTAFGNRPGDVSNPLFPRISNIMEFDTTSGKYRVIYGGIEGQEMLSIIRGKVEQTRNGGLLITEFEGGRVIETDAMGRIIWEYINRYDSDEVAEITEARIYPASYFNVSNWLCE